MTREALIREIRRLARKNGVRFEVIVSHGKGSHYRVEYADKWTTVKSGELAPGYVALIKRQLGIA